MDGPQPSGTPRARRSDVPDEVYELVEKLFDMARTGATEELASYLDAGVTSDLTNDRGDTLLMLAAYNGHEETVATLLARGADTERANDRGQTPLAGAVFKSYGTIVKILFEAGADPRAGTPSAIDAARMFEKDAFLELFAGQ